MKIAICDDDKIIIDQVDTMIAEYYERHDKEIPEIKKYDSGNALCDDSFIPDIVFLDIEMPGGNGLLAGNELKKKNPDIIIIIITSYMDYLDDAMRLAVFRYISKPIILSRFLRNFDDAIKKYSKLHRHILIKTSDGMGKIELGDLVFIETEKRKCIIHTVARDIIGLENISYWEDFLKNKDDFYSPNRSFVINLSYVTGFSHDEITLCDGKYSVLLSRRKYKDFKTIYIRFLEKE